MRYLEWSRINVGNQTLRALLWASLTLSGACAPSRNLVYFSNLNGKEYSQPITNSFPVLIQENDQLSITVRSMNPESNTLWNAGAPKPGTSPDGAGTEQRLTEGYTVDKNGFITLPAIGRISVAGLSREDVTEKITKILAKDYVKNPIVNVRLINFKVTVIGEVRRPATFTVNNEKLSVLEALGLAGDMTEYGKRENVMVIREKEGVRKAFRLNLNDMNVMDSPYYYLQQNDVVYVEPDRAKALQASSRNYYLPIVISAISVLILIISTFR